MCDICAYTKSLPVVSSGKGTVKKKSHKRKGVYVSQLVKGSDVRSKVLLIIVYNNNNNNNYYYYYKRLQV